MKHVYQNKFGVGTGNCLAACAASIMEVDIDLLPLPVPGADEEEDGAWFYRLDGACRPLGFVAGFHHEQPAAGEVCIAIVRGPPRHRHAVVALDGEILHNPDNRYPTTWNLKEFPPEAWISIRRVPSG